MSDATKPKTCSHDPYWTTIYERCMACQRDQARAEAIEEAAAWAQTDRGAVPSKAYAQRMKDALTPKPEKLHDYRSGHRGSGVWRKWCESQLDRTRNELRHLAIAIERLRKGDDHE